MIILTAAQAAFVQGMDTPGHALLPILLADGSTYVLNENVLGDPAHQEKWVVLSTYPTRTVAPSEYVQGAP